MNEAQCTFFWLSMTCMDEVNHSTKYLILRSKKVRFGMKRGWGKCWRNIFNPFFNQLAHSLAASSAVIRMVFCRLEKCFRMWKLKLWWRGRKSKLFWKNFTTASVGEWNEKGWRSIVPTQNYTTSITMLLLLKSKTWQESYAQWHPHRTKLISRIPKKKKHILSAYSHLQFNTLKDQCLFTSSRHCDNLEDRQKRVFSVLKALKGNAERSKPNANDKRRKRGPQGCQLVLNIAQLVEMSGFGSPPSTSLSRLSCWVRIALDMIVTSILRRFSQLSYIWRKELCAPQQQVTYIRG